jgi:hypothetical protein
MIHKIIENIGIYNYCTLHNIAPDIYPSVTECENIDCISIPEITTILCEGVTPAELKCQLSSYIDGGCPSSSVEKILLPKPICVNSELSLYTIFIIFVVLTVFLSFSYGIFFSTYKWT